MQNNNTVVTNDIENIDIVDRLTLEKMRKDSLNSLKRWESDGVIGDVFKASDAADTLARIDAKRKPVVAANVDDDDDGELFDYPERPDDYNAKWCRKILVDSDTNTFVKSPKGSGKTERLKEVMKEAKAVDGAVNAFVKSSKSMECLKEGMADDFDVSNVVVKSLEAAGKRVLLIGHRVSLLSSMAKRLELEFYQDFNPTKPMLKGDAGERALMEKAYESKVKRAKAKMRKADTLAICMDSLHYLRDAKGITAEYDIVIMDESEQVLRHLGAVGGTIDNDVKRKAIIEVLMDVVGECDQLIMLDADLSLLSINVAGYLHDCTYEDFSNNHYKVDGNSMSVWADRNAMEEEMCNAAVDGESIFYTCSSNNQCAYLQSKLHSMGVSKNVTVICGNNSATQKTRDYIQLLNDAEGDDLAGHVVLTTPTLGTGVDISAPFDRVYGAFGAGVLTHFDMDQQIARVRNPQNISVWVQGRQDFELTEANRIEQRYMRNHRLSAKLAGVQIKRHFEEWEKFFMYLNTMCKALENTAKNNVLKNFVDMKTDQGWSIKYVKKI